MDSSPRNWEKHKVAPLLMRPGMRIYAHFEHVIVFAVFGALFAFAYPNT
jgi:hypothetical protein